MAKKHVVWLVALTAGVLAMLAVWLFRPTPEPSYRGKSLSAWLAGYNAQSLNWPAKPQPPDDAIWEIGADALPAITRRLRSRDSGIKIKFQEVILTYLHIRFPIRTQNEKQTEALGALYELNRQARSIVPTVAEALNGMADWNQLAAVHWLGNLGSDGEPAVPALVQLLQNTNSDSLSRVEAISALYSVGRNQTNLLKNAMVRCSQDPDGLVRFHVTARLKCWTQDMAERAAAASTKEMTNQLQFR